MEVKKIVEGMTAPQVAQVIDDNFKAQNKILEDDIATQNSVIGVSEYKDFSEAEAVNVGDVRKYNGLLYECVEATTGVFDASKWKKSSFKAETEKKLSELGSEVRLLQSPFQYKDLSSFAELAIDKYINYEDGSLASAGTGTKADLYIIRKEDFGNAQSILVKASYRSDLMAAIAFYKDEITPSGYIKDGSVQSHDTEGDFFKATIPSNANIIAISNIRVWVSKPSIELMYQPRLAELEDSLLLSWIICESFMITDASYTDGVIVSPINVVWPNGEKGSISIERNEEGLIIELFVYVGEIQKTLHINRDSEGNVLSTLIN